MAYNKLNRESGGDMESRIDEAHHICQILEDAGVMDNLNKKEHDFVTDMASCDYCSVNQLFWLRDIKDKYA